MSDLGPFYGPQWDVERAKRNYQALTILENAREVGISSHFRTTYFAVKIPFYRGRPAEPTVEDRDYIEMLVDTLRTDRVPRNASLAWEKLVRIGPPAVPYLVAVLQSPDEQQREMAASILGRIGGDDVIAALVAQLSDDHIRHNALAAYLALLEIGGPAIPALENAAKSSDRQQSTFARCLLDALGETD